MKDFEKEFSCSCELCRDACRHKPGWFKPHEIALLAEFFKMETPELFKTYLGVDWWNSVDDNGDIFLLAPALDCMDPGDTYPRDPRGRCIFFDNNEKCGIYSARPYECRVLHHDNFAEKSLETHKKVAKTWLPFQDMVRELLGREPEALQFGLFDMLKLPRMY